MKTYKLVKNQLDGQDSVYANELVDGTPTGVLVHRELNQEYLKWLEEGNTPIAADATEPADTQGA